jgi:hypothetical protein
MKDGWLETQKWGRGELGVKGKDDEIDVMDGLSVRVERRDNLTCE